MPAKGSDQRLLAELRKENEELKAEIAVLEYNEEALTHALADANTNGLAEVCRCHACFFARRFECLDREDVQDRFPLPSEHANAECIIKKCLMAECEHLGLVCIDYMNDDDDEDGADCEPDENCHLMLVTEKGSTGWTVYYGQRLSLSHNFHRHPDLPKLKTLFETLGEKAAFFRHCPEALCAANERWIRDSNSPAEY